MRKDGRALDELRSIELIPDFSTPQSENVQPYTYLNYNKFKVIGTNIKVKYVFDNKLTVNVGVGYTGRKYMISEELSSDDFFFSPE